jgi:hypothetical protein
MNSDADQHHNVQDEEQASVVMMSNSELTRCAPSLADPANVSEFVIEDEQQSLARDFQELEGVKLGRGLWY